MDNASEAAAGDVLRRWALDEELKHLVMSSPELSAVASRISRRYTAGETIDSAIAAARASMARGHLVSLEYAGESVRDAHVAVAETEVFLALIERLREADIAATVSFDLSHVGSLVDPGLAARNARRMASAVEQLGTTLMISAEGSDRTDLVLDLYDELSRDHANVGITLQARLHRSAEDLDRLLDRPGQIRLVKGSFLEPVDVALPRGSRELHDAYLRFAGRLVDSGHPTSIATHDADLIDAITTRHPDPTTAPHVEFEMLLGLGTDLHDRLRRDGYRTREYTVFGGEWWLYVLNRIAEEPRRVYDAILAAGAGGS
jgi:proline dehydrogenase